MAVTTSMSYLVFSGRKPPNKGERTMGSKVQTERVLIAPAGVEILTRQQVAERLGISPKSIYTLVRSRVAVPMPAHYAGKELRFIWGEVFDWFINRKRKPRVVVGQGRRRRCKKIMVGKT